MGDETSCNHGGVIDGKGGVGVSANAYSLVHDQLPPPLGESQIRPDC